MSREFFIFYTEATFVCIATYCILYLHSIKKNSRHEKQISFYQAMKAQALYFISDNFWAAVASGVVPQTRANIVISHFLNYVLLSVLFYKWFIYTAIYLDLPQRKTRRGQLIFAFPSIIVVAFFTITYLIWPEIWISTDNQIQDLYYIFVIIAPSVYIVSSLVLSLSRLQKEHNTIKRNILLRLGMYPLVLTFSGVLQIALHNAPMFCFGCMLMMISFYTTLLSDQISIDELTGLNNRGKLDRFAQTSHAADKGVQNAYVMMIDANHFKYINDTFGHAEGDRALTLIADVLRSSVKNMEPAPFLARYGGDEFVIIVYADSLQPVLDLKVRILDGLRTVSKAKQLPYKLDTAIGYSEYTGKSDSFEECLQRADEMLYREKRA